MPSPRSAAAATLSVLAFGVVIGSGNTGFASSPLSFVINVLAGHSAPASPTSLASAPSGGAPSGGGAGPAVGGGPSGGGGGGAGATTPVGGTTTPTTTPSQPASAGYPPVKHLFLITLADQGYNQTFSPTTGDSYLAHVLVREGMVIPSFFSVAQSELPNEIATLSGQGPTRQTEQGCPAYTAIKLRQQQKRKQPTYDQVLGNGCVYPKSTPTLLSQLQAADYTWKAYIQGLGKRWSSKSSVARARRRRADAKPAGAKVTLSGQAAAATCRHPQLGARDSFHLVSGSDAYVTWKNPLMYFAAVTDSKSCNSQDVGLNQLGGDLAATKSTPNLTLIYPDPCDDGSDTPCKKGAKNTGIAGADAFLRQVLPPILKSPAYKQDGMVIITFDQAPQTGPNADHSSCCGNPTYPNLSPHAVLLSNSSISHATSTPGVTSTPTGVTTSTTPTPTTPTGTAPTGTTPTGTAPTGTTPTGVTTSTSPGCTATTPTGTTPTGTGTTPTGTGTTPTGTGTTPTGTGTTPTTDSGCTTTTTTTTTTTPPPPLEPACIVFGTCKATGGGGQVGLLILSKFVKPRSIDPLAVYNDYSLLQSIENMFGLPNGLGYSASSSVKPFDAGSQGVYNNYGS